MTATERTKQQDQRRATLLSYGTQTKPHDKPKVVISPPVGTNPTPARTSDNETTATSTGGNPGRPAAGDLARSWSSHNGTKPGVGVSASFPSSQDVGLNGSNLAAIPSRQRVALTSEDYVPRTMPTILGKFDMTATYVCALFLITNAVIVATGGTVSLIYLVLGGITFFIPCVIATAQLGVILPHEGSLYNWTYHALGSFWSFFIGVCFWLSGVLAIVLGANAFVTILQGLHHSWLTQPWQQGAVMLVLTAFGAYMGTRRFRMVQNFFNLIFCLTLIATALVGISAVVWLTRGHVSMTSFNHPGDWAIDSSSFALFGVISLNFIGASGPLNMGGELAGRKERVIKSHLLWGTLIVFVCYFVTTLSVLIVRGPAIMNAFVLPFEIVTTVDVVLGKLAGDIVVVCILCYCCIAVTFYTYSSARLLMAAGIDQRLPSLIGRLNKNRVPANASILQALVTAIITIVIFMGAPYIIALGTPANLATMFYTVNSAALTIVWTIATAFFFIDLVYLYMHDPRGFRRKRIFPMPIIWTSALIGFAACFLTIVDTLFNSWIPQMIGNGTWWYIVGGLTIFCLLVAAGASAYATGEADWEVLSAGE
jgi:glutamate:GABA antiporter